MTVKQNQFILFQGYITAKNESLILNILLSFVLSTRQIFYKILLSNVTKVMQW